MYCVARRVPNIEKFALANQIWRTAVSLTNNITERHGRYHYLDQIKFLRQPRGSLQELIDDFNVCMDEQYLSDGEIISLKEEGWRARQLIDGYVRYLRTRRAPQALLRFMKHRQLIMMLKSWTTIHESRFNELR
jgi:four helix bundle protein